MKCLVHDCVLDSRRERILLVLLSWHGTNRLSRLVLIGGEGMREARLHIVKVAVWGCGDPIDRCRFGGICLSISVRTREAGLGR